MVKHRDGKTASKWMQKDVSHVQYVKVAWLFECGESNVDVKLKLKLSLKIFIH